MCFVMEPSILWSSTNSMTILPSHRFPRWLKCFFRVLICIYTHQRVEDCSLLVILVNLVELTMHSIQVKQKIISMKMERFQTTAVPPIIPITELLLMSFLSNNTPSMKEKGEQRSATNRFFLQIVLSKLMLINRWVVLLILTILTICYRLTCKGQLIFSQDKNSLAVIIRSSI